MRKCLVLVEMQREERFENVSFAKKSRIFEGVEKKVKNNNKEGKRNEKGDWVMEKKEEKLKRVKLEA